MAEYVRIRTVECAMQKWQIQHFLPGNNASLPRLGKIDLDVDRALVQSVPWKRR